MKLEKIDFQTSKILKKFSCTLPQEIMENDALQQIKEFKQKETKTETHVASRKQGKQWLTLFLGSPKSLHMVTAAMKLKDTYSLEGKL